MFRDLIPYCSISLVAKRQADALGDVAANIFNWQGIQSTPEATGNMLAAYAGILNFVSNSDSSVLALSTPLFSYGSIDITVSTGDSIGKRSVGILVPIQKVIFRRL